MNTYQSTINTAVTVAGIGLHTGEEVRMTFKPADPYSGIRFSRTDLPGNPTVKADVDAVVDVSRGTTIASNGVKVNTVEHVMAALSGLQIDNLLVELDNVETPIMDGSSQVFVEAILGVGIRKQPVAREYFELKNSIIYRNEENNVELVAVPSNEFQVSVMIDYNSKVLGQQHATVERITDFKEEFAASRTFCFLHELEMLLDRNLIKGGDLNNAIVVVDKKVNDEDLTHLAKLFNKPQVKVLKEGILNNVELRYPNEPARHKLLDVIGDLSLLGVPIKAKIIASRPGHAANIEFTKLLKAEYVKSKQTTMAPKYDPNEPPLIDILGIQRLLPHRFPFLLVDKIIELTTTRVVGVKNVSFNEGFFQGHFPSEPVMPGVLILEAMAQTGGILILSTVDNPADYVTYFLKIDKAKFKSKVVPGDTVVFEMELLSPLRRGLCEMKATAFVGNRIVATAEMVAQVSKMGTK